jgi:BirA family biotin operon repressor/biotin-[acetyl-CoA-carboxylase] ligase
VLVDEAARSRLAGTRFTRVDELAETTSTNSVVAALAREGAPEGLVVVADYQSAGRGRFDRRWESPPGKSLLFSVLLRPSELELPPRRRHLAVAAVALALAAAAEEVAGVDVQLKWPNDLVAGDLKVAGVLAEAEGDFVVVGAGVNVAWAPEGLGATCLDDLAGRRVERAGLLASCLLALEALCGNWEEVARRYRDRCATVGREVTVKFPGGAEDLRGVAIALDEDGHLVVRERGPGRLVTVAAGDVLHARGGGGS